MVTKQKISIIQAYSDDVGEVEGAFDKDGNLLGSWHANDGDWRSEYFDGFMKNLGIVISYKPKNREELQQKLIEAYL